MTANYNGLGNSGHSSFHYVAAVRLVTSLLEDKASGSIPGRVFSCLLTIMKPTRKQWS